MKSRLSCRIAGAVYYAFYLLFYAGWFFHRSIHHYPVRYTIVLILLAAFFFVPPLLFRAAETIGRRRLLFALLPCAAVLGVIYAGSSLAYYYTRLHPFDPMLQKPPPLLTAYSIEKQPGVFRILALGGSTTANRDLPTEARYPRQLEAILQQRHPTLKIEVINAGKGWYTTQHSLINYVSHVQSWQPDLVVVMHAVNDLYRSFSPPKYSIGGYNERWSHFYGPSIRGARPPTFEAAWAEETFGKCWYESIRIRPRDVPLDRFRSLPEFERNLKALGHYLRVDGCEVLLATQPSLYKSKMTDEELRTLWFARTFCIESKGFWRQTFPSPGSMRRAMDRYNDVVRDVTRSGGIPLADVEPGVPRNLNHFRDDVHYTAAGARIVAEIVADRICAGEYLEAGTTIRMK